MIFWKLGEKRGVFWCYLKRCFGIWNWWENVEIMDDRWCIMTLFKSMFLKSELLLIVLKQGLKWCILTLFETKFFRFKLLRKLWKQGENVVHSDVIWNDALEVVPTCVRKKLKLRTIDGAFWRYFKRCSWKN